MTIKDDEDLEKELIELLVPWDWNDVILPDFNDAYFDWCKERSLEFGKDFFLHIDEPIYEKNDSGWPFKTSREIKHHYLFKDPAIATAFSLTFLT